MDFERLIDAITPEIYDQLKRAIELGKWGNGVSLTNEQKASCLQAIIAYDNKHHEQTERVGYVAPKPHIACGEEEDEWQPIRLDDK